MGNAGDGATLRAPVGRSPGTLGSAAHTGRRPADGRRPTVFSLYGEKTTKLRNRWNPCQGWCARLGSNQQPLPSEGEIAQVHTRPCASKHLIIRDFKPKFLTSFQLVLLRITGALRHFSAHSPDQSAPRHPPPTVQFVPSCWPPTHLSRRRTTRSPIPRHQPA
jgi:hypothetical protein